MAKLTPFFSASRSVREYTDRYYIPSAAAYKERAAENGALGAQVVAWRRMLDEYWPAIRFGDVTVETSGEMRTISVQVYGDELVQNAVRVELYAEGLNGAAAAPLEMVRVRKLEGSNAGWLFSARVPADRPATDYTARVMSQHPGVAIPLEDARILWQR
jgi:starch phosphorylase